MKKFSLSNAPAWKKALASMPAFVICASAYAQVQGPSSSQTPYQLPSTSGVVTTSILTTGDSVPKVGGGSYLMAGIPDGLGAFDNGNGTFTVLMNHEIGFNSAGAPLGAVRDHDAASAFVSKYVIDKASLKVVSGVDQIQSVQLWDAATSSYVTPATGSPLTAFNRFCSADLPAVSALYDAKTGLGTTERIFLNGEESGAEGRAMAHVVGTGVSYELPRLGKFSFENSLANPTAQAKTIVMSNDDSTVDGGVYMYVGTKQNTGSVIDKAGLSNGNLYTVKVAGGAPQNEVRATGFDGVAGNKDSQRFEMVNLGNVSNKTGSQLNTDTKAAGGTGFLRPEDGSWDPKNPGDYYFVTTDQFSQVKEGTGAQVGKSRLWRMRYDDISNPENGGEISMILNGDLAGNMFDNITVTEDGKIVLLEDVGNNAHNGKAYEYDISTGTLKEILHHDVTRFGDIGTPATAPFTTDEEASGVIPVDFLGLGKLLVVTQAHYPNGAELFEGGQLMLVDTNPVPEASTVVPTALLGLAGAARYARGRFSRKAVK